MPSFRVYGVPAPKGSKKHYGNGNFVEVSKKLPAWQKKMAAVFKEYDGPVIDTPVVVTAVFYMPRPKRPKFSVPAVPPDLDKLQRALGDALERAGVVKNDSLIVEWHAEKVYVDESEAGAAVEVERLGDP